MHRIQPRHAGPPAIVLSETWTAPVDGRTVSHPAG